MIACSRRPTAPRSSAATPPAAGCSPTAARAAATCSPARPTRRSSPSAGPRPRSAPTPATGRSWPTASTSRATLVLFSVEIVLEVTAALRAARRDVRPRGHRGGIYPLMRAAMCVIVRDLIVYGVLTDMMRGRPAVYATFSSYDEVAHHSGLERADTLEALRKLDKQFARHRARAPLRPAPVRDRRALRPRADAGRDVQAAQRLRARRARRALARPRHVGRARRRRRAGRDGRARGGRGDRAQPEKPAEVRRLRPRRRGPGLGQPRARLPDGAAAAADARGDRRAPSRAAPGAARAPARRLAARPLGGARRRRARRAAALATSTRIASRARTRSRRSRPTRAQHLLRTDGFANVADIMVGSFYDPALDEGCAFEELISFHGGLGGPQTRAVHPLPARARAARREPLIGAAAVHGPAARVARGAAGRASPVRWTTITGRCGVAQQPRGRSSRAGGT